MTITYIKTPLATLEFESAMYTGDTNVYLSMCAYGDFWGETFKNHEEMAKYLKETWKLTDEQVALIVANEEHLTLEEGKYEGSLS